MKILLAVDKHNDPALVSAYFARRLDGKTAEIDVLSVIPSSDDSAGIFAERPAPEREDARRQQQYREACVATSGIAAVLRLQQGVQAVRTHILSGDPADVIMDCARRMRSELLLIGAPQRHGLLTAFRLDGVTRRLMKWSDCPLELLRPVSERAAAANTILIPLPVNLAHTVPFQQLQALPWTKGSRVHLLGVMPPCFDDARAEASAAALLLALQGGRDARAKAAVKLDAVGIAMSKALRGGLDITHEVVEGKLRDATVAKARELHPTLIVLHPFCLDGGHDRLFGSLSPAALAISVTCSVLLLQDDPPHANTARLNEPAPILKLAR